MERAASAEACGIAPGPVIGRRHVILSLSKDTAASEQCGSDADAKDIATRSYRLHLLLP